MTTTMANVNINIQEKVVDGRKYREYSYRILVPIDSCESFASCCPLCGPKEGKVRFIIDIKNQSAKKQPKKQPSSPKNNSEQQVDWAKLEQEEAELLKEEREVADWRSKYKNSDLVARGKHGSMIRFDSHKRTIGRKREALEKRKAIAKAQAASAKPEHSSASHHCGTPERVRTVGHLVDGQDEREADVASTQDPCKLAKPPCTPKKQVRVQGKSGQLVLIPSVKRQQRRDRQLSQLQSKIDQLSRSNEILRMSNDDFERMKMQELAAERIASNERVKLGEATWQLQTTEQEATRREQEATRQGITLQARERQNLIQGLGRAPVPAAARAPDLISFDAGTTAFVPAAVTVPKSDATTTTATSTLGSGSTSTSGPPAASSGPPAATSGPPAASSGPTTPTGGGVKPMVTTPTPETIQYCHNGRQVFKIVGKRVIDGKLQLGIEVAAGQIEWCVQSGNIPVFNTEDEAKQALFQAQQQSQAPSASS